MMKKIRNYNLYKVLILFIRNVTKARLTKGLWFGVMQNIFLLESHKNQCHAVSHDVWRVKTFIPAEDIIWRLMRGCCLFKCVCTPDCKTESTILSSSFIQLFRQDNFTLTGVGVIQKCELYAGKLKFKFLKGVKPIISTNISIIDMNSYQCRVRCQRWKCDFYKTWRKQTELLR